MTFNTTFRKLWGSDSSKTFRLAAWAVAIGVFGAYTYWDSKPVITDNRQVKISPVAESSIKEEKK